MAVPRALIGLLECAHGLPFKTSSAGGPVTSPRNADGAARPMSRRGPTASPRRAQAKSASDRAFPEQPPRSDGGTPEVVMLDGKARIVEVNDAWRRSVAAYGIPMANAGIGASYIDVACGCVPETNRQALELKIQRLLSGSMSELRHTYVLLLGGRRRWRRLHITPLPPGSECRLLAIHEDITELAEVQEALRDSGEQILSARDDERQRIAIELHDSTSQHLAAMSLGLARLRRAVGGSDAGGEIIAEMERSLNEAVKETRVLAYLMKPRGLGPNGLSSTVLQFLSGYAMRTKLEVALEADPAVDRAPAALQHAALRIIQEALLNANRHAHAHHVSVEIGMDGQMLTLSVTDDGQGIRGDHGEPHLGVGIPGMRARAQQLSGHLTITSGESGTCVAAALPLH